jgi:hypothetical protein
VGSRKLGGMKGELRDDAEVVGSAKLSFRLS